MTGSSLQMDGETVAVTDELLELRLILYLIFGGITMVCNIPIIMVFFSTKEMRRKFALFQFLAFADLVSFLCFKRFQINGVSIFSAGLFRLIVLRAGDFYKPVTPAQCLSTYPWPVLFVIAGQSSRKGRCCRSISFMGLPLHGR